MSDSESSTKVAKLCNTCCYRVEKLEQINRGLKEKEKFNEYLINHLKAELRLCLDTLKKVKTATAKAINEQEEMSEVLESRLERESHLTYNGDEMYYPGEQTIAECQADN